MRIQSHHLLYLVLFFFLVAPLQAFAAQATPIPAGQAEVADDFDDDPFAEEEASVDIADPIEGVNRGFFWFNDKLYFYLLKPAAQVWRVVPEPARISVDNFFHNLVFPKRFVNNTLQGKLDGTVTETGRFLVNSTIGVLGLFDPAKSWFGWEKYDEDTGQTLGAWGAGHGFYLVLPVFGPSSLRDGVGRVGDYFLDPLTYVELKTEERVGIRVLETVNYISIDKDTYEAIKKDALDPYLFVRDSYVQRRAKAVAE